MEHRCRKKDCDAVLPVTGSVDGVRTIICPKCGTVNKITSFVGKFRLRW